MESQRTESKLMIAKGDVRGQTQGQMRKHPKEEEEEK